MSNSQYDFDLSVSIKQVLDADSASQVEQQIEKQRKKLEEPIKIKLDTKTAKSQIEKITGEMKDLSTAQGAIQKDLQKAMSDGDTELVRSLSKDLDKVDDQLKQREARLKSINKELRSRKDEMKAERGKSRKLSAEEKEIDKLIVTSALKRKIKPKDVSAETAEVKKNTDALKENTDAAKRNAEAKIQSHKQGDIQSISAALEKEKKSLKEIEEQQKHNDYAYDKLTSAKANYGKEILGSDKAVYDTDKIENARKELSSFNSELEKRNQFQERYQQLCKIISDSFVGKYSLSNGVHNSLDDVIASDVSMKELSKLMRDGIKGVPTKHINSLFQSVARSLMQDVTDVSRYISSGDVLGARVFHDLDEQENQLIEERNRLYDSRETQLTRIAALREQELNLIIQASQEEKKASEIDEKKVDKAKKEAAQQSVQESSIDETQKQIDKNKELEESYERVAYSIKEIREIENAHDVARDRVTIARGLIVEAEKELDSLQKSAEVFGFTNGMSAIKAGKARQVLEKNNRGRYVVDMLKKGYSPIQTSSGEYGFDRPDIGKNVYTKITKTEYEYAKYLTEEIQKMNVGWDEGLKILESHGGKLEEQKQKIEELRNELTILEKEEELAYENMSLAHSGLRKKSDSQSKDENIKQEIENNEKLTITYDELLQKFTEYAKIKSKAVAMHERGEDISDLVPTLRSMEDDMAQYIPEHHDDPLYDRVGIRAQLQSYKGDDEIHVFQTMCNLLGIEIPSSANKAEDAIKSVSDKIEQIDEQQQLSLFDGQEESAKNVAAQEEKAADAAQERLNTEKQITDEQQKQANSQKEIITEEKKEEKNKKSRKKKKKEDVSEEATSTTVDTSDIDKATEKTNEFADASKAAADAAKETSKAVDAESNKFDELPKKAKKGTKAKNEFTKENKELGKQAEKSADAIDEEGESANQLQNMNAHKIVSNFDGNGNYIGGVLTDWSRDGRGSSQRTTVVDADTNIIGQSYIENIQNYRKQYESELRKWQNVTQSIQGQTSAGTQFNNVLQSKITQYRNELDALEAMVDALEADHNLMYDNDFNDRFNRQAASVQRLKKEVTDITKTWKSYGNEIGHIAADTTDLTTLEQSMRNYADNISNGTASAVDFDSKHKVLTATMRNTHGEVEKLTIAFREGTNQIYAYGDSATSIQSPFAKLKDALSNGFTQLAGMYVGIHEFIQYFRQGVGYVKDIDAAMTELRKVTDETEESYANFLQTASPKAGKIGSTIKDLTTVTSDFARLGYNIEEASMLAETALIYENVGDGFSSVQEASESVISTMMAFGIATNDTMSIVDKFNEVGNNFAIDSKGIGDALQRSASALFEGGNSIDESIGLITAANSVIQDPAQVGTALKTLTLRLRGAKIELEEAGLDAEDMASSVSTLRDKLLALTDGKVDIMLDANTFKNTTQILREMSAVWQDMTDIEQASALELMGGKRQANILSSMINNFEVVEKVINTAANSAGSALKENETHLDSVQGRIDLFNNALQTMWSNTLDTDWIKNFIDIGTSMINMLDTGTGKVLAFAAALQLIGKSKGFGIEELIGEISEKGIGNVATSFMSGNWFAVALSAIPLIIGLINKLKNHSAELKHEVHNITAAYKDQKEVISDNLNQLTKSSNTNIYATLEDEFESLASGVDENGNNISLTADEYERYRAICETIIGINPRLALGYDSATEAIGNNCSALSQLIELQKLEARLAATEFVSDDNLKKFANDAINDYNDVKNDIYQAASDLLTDGIAEEFSVSNSTNPFRDNIKKMLEYLELPEEEIEKSLEPYTTGASSFNFEGWIQENIDVLSANVDKLPNSMRPLIDAYESVARKLEPAQQGLRDTLLNIPASLKEYEELSIGEQSFVTDWILNSGLFEIDDDTTSKEVLTWKSKIQDFIYDLSDGDYKVDVDGAEVTVSDILDSIFSLDKSAIDFTKYKTEMSELVELLWQAIGGENNTLGFKDKGALSKMFGFDEENIKKQEEEMYQRIENIVGKEQAEKIKKQIEDMPATKVERLLKLDWNVIDVSNLDNVLNDTFAPSDFTTANFANYSDSIDSIQSNISSLQSAYESLLSGDFSYADFLDLIQQFPELAEGVDLASGSFDGLADNLKKAIKNAPDELTDELKDLRKELVATGKSTEYVDMLINTLENMPTGALDEMIKKYGGLADSMEEVVTANSNLEKAMSEDPTSDYKNWSEGVQKMQELYENGVVGSESQLWSIMESMTGQGFDYGKSIEENLKRYNNLMQTITPWLLGPEDDPYSTAGASNFMSYMESLVAEAKSSGEEWAQGIEWTYDENGIANIRMTRDEFDALANSTGDAAIATKMMYEYLGQYLKIDWNDGQGIVSHFKQVQEIGANAAEEFDKAKDELKAYLESRGLSTEWLNSGITGIVDGQRIDQLDEESKQVILEYYKAKSNIEKDPIRIKTILDSDDLEDGISEEALSAINQLTPSVTADNGELWFSFDEFRKAAKDAGYAEGAIDGLLSKLEEFNAKDLKVTEEDPFGLVALGSNAQLAIEYLNRVGIAAQQVGDNIQIDVPSLVSILKANGWDAQQVQNYVNTLSQNGYTFTAPNFNFSDGIKDANGNVTFTSNSSEVSAAIDELYGKAEDPPDVYIKTALDGTASKAITTLKQQIDSLNGQTFSFTVDCDVKGTEDIPKLANGTANNGIVGVNGTAHAHGTAFKSGSWGAPRTETALVGELGTEILVRDGQWTTIGDNGAEFRNIKKGDIIFNHKQSEQLLKHGYVTGRGKAYASGTAYGDGAFGGFKKVWDGIKKLFGGGSGNKTSNDTPKSSESNKTNTNVVVVTNPTPGETPLLREMPKLPNSTSTTGEGKIPSGPKSGGSSGGGGGTDSGSSSDESKQLVDFIEFKLEEIESEISKVTAKIALFLDDTSDIIDKDKHYDKLVEAEKNKASTYFSAAEEYNKKAKELLEEVPEEYRDMAQNGAIAIEDFTGEDDIVNAINEYRDFANKADEAEVGYLEAVAQAAAYRVEQLDDIATDFENLTNQIETQAGLVESHMDLIEESGNIVSEKFYKDLIAKTEEQRKELVREKKELQKILDDSVKAGEVIVGTDEWFEMVQAIYDVDEAIVDCDISLEGFQNDINDLKFESFARIQNQLDNIDSQLSNIADLLTKYDWEIVSEDGLWTDKGIAAMGMYAQQMEIAQTKSQQYQKEINELNKLYDKGLVSETEYTEQLAELKDSQFDAVKSYEAAKDAIVDLNKVRVEAVKEGIKKELEAYQELINKKKEALDADRDMHDYEKNVAEKQKEISKIERKLAALSGDSSISATAQRRELQEQLLKAQEELEEIYRDRSYDNTINALDKEAEEYEKNANSEMEALDKSLEDINTIVSTSLNTVKENTGSVISELTELGNTYGIELSEAITTPWQDGTMAISAYNESFKTLKDSFAEQLDELIKKEKELQTEASSAAQEVLTSLGENEKQVERAKNPEGSGILDNLGGDDFNSTAGMISDMSGTIEYGHTGSRVKTLQYVLNKLGFNAGAEDGVFGDATLNAVKEFQKSTKYGAAVSADGIVGTDTKKKFKLAGYAKGTTGVKNNQFAWIDELGEELVLRAGPDGKLSYMTKGTGVVPSDLTSKLIDLALDPTQVLENSRPVISAPQITNNEINIDMSVGELIHIDHADNSMIPDLTKMVKKEFDKYLVELNNQMRKYAR